MVVRAWRFVTILLVALLVGLAFAHVLERPAKIQYDAELYITLQRGLSTLHGVRRIGRRIATDGGLLKQPDKQESAGNSRSRAAACKDVEARDRSRVGVPVPLHRYWTFHPVQIAFLSDLRVERIANDEG